MQVTFDAAYTLPKATAPTVFQEFLCWKDADGKEVKDGTWTIAGDVTLTAVYNNGLTFDDATAAPSYFSGSRTQSISLVEMNGGKAIEVKSADNEPSDIGVHVKLDFVAEFFKNSNIEYMAFDLKLASDATTTFKQIYFQDFSTGSSAWTAYETAKKEDYFSAPTGAFKTYYLSRAAYQAWVDNNQTNPHFLMIGKGLGNGQSFYLDNFRPVTAEGKAQDWWSFEYGGIRTADGAMFYRADNDQWELNFSNVVNGTLKFTSDIVSDGSSALMFTKKAGDSKVVLNHNVDTAGELELRAAGYMKYDLYVPEGSDIQVMDIKGTGWYAPLKQGWNTVYTRIDATDTGIIRLKDTTGGTYVIDNIRFVSADEYFEKAGSFETGAGVLRGATFTEGAKETAYYYTGVDVYKNAFSISIGEGDNNVLTKVCLSSAQAYDGEMSLSFTKNNGYMSFSMRNNSDGSSDMYDRLKNGFTFWIYADLDVQPAINGTSTSNFSNGVNGKFNGGVGLNITARTWTQVTVTAEDINSSGRFLIIQGSTAGTYYLDGFQPLSAE